MSEARGGVEVVTFGCRLNGVESAAMRTAAEAAGHVDLVIVNTCAVTGEAVRQARQAIRRVKRERPQAPIVVTGCAAEVERSQFAAMPEVAAILANRTKAEPSTWQRLILQRGAGDGSVPPLCQEPPPAATACPTLHDRTRGFVAVQNGCDHRCTFCIIPFGRGASRSVPADKVIDQARQLVAAGHREIVLTGVDITSYGADLADSPRLGALVKRVLREVPALDRLRLSSLDCVEVDRDLVDALATEPRLMPHLHLSLQAGDDLVLKRMKRRHSFAEAVRLCRMLRDLRPEVVFGADIIAGFPTETDAMFQRSLDLIAACGITYLHVFPFSPRKGTPAARMPQVPARVIKERALRLREAGAAALQAHLARQVGSRLTLLGERGGLARAEDFTPVRGSRIGPGEIGEVRIADHDARTLIAA